jgi:hypothetical protein
MVQNTTKEQGSFNINFGYILLCYIPWSEKQFSLKKKRFALLTTSNKDGILSRNLITFYQKMVALLHEIIMKSQNHPNIL